MAEYIDREVFKKSVEEYYCKPCKADGKDHNGCWCRVCWVDDMLYEIDCFQPAADVAPVLHGMWEYEEPTYGMVKCTVCNWWAIDPYVSIVYHYYPNCGAKMDGDGNG